jgi:hypothetical protein
LAPGLEIGTDVAIAAVITLGLAITSIVFAIEIFIRWLLSLAKRKWSSTGQRPKRPEYPEIIFHADREKELGWYFWQLWGQSIMHENIAVGLAIIYVVYRFSNYEVWPTSSLHYTWRDWTLVVILANFICWWKFLRWHTALMSKLQHEGT